MKVKNIRYLVEILLYTYMQTFVVLCGNVLVLSKTINFQTSEIVLRMLKKRMTDATSSCHSKANRSRVDYLSCVANDLFFPVGSPNPYREFGKVTGVKMMEVSETYLTNHTLADHCREDDGITCRLDCSWRHELQLVSYCQYSLIRFTRLQRNRNCMIPAGCTPVRPFVRSSFTKCTIMYGEKRLEAKVSIHIRVQRIVHCQFSSE